MNYGLYIHIPFCKEKCKYCDFLSFPCMEKYFDEYVDALVNEIKLTGEKHSELQGCPVEVDTVFIGGGTPSLLSEKAFEEIFKEIYRSFKIKESAEITVEANPGTVSYEKLKYLRELGVNRLSMGVQSLDNDTLKFLGRIHNAGEAINAFYEARNAGFENINLDLIFGMPFDDRDSFRKTLEKVVELSPEHISCYSLIVEEGTVLQKLIDRGDVAYPSDEVDREDYYFCKERLKKAGYRQYEISNFAKKGFESRHNMRYWKQKEYIGIGLGSASFIDGKRFSNSSDFKAYVLSKGNAPKEECISLGRKELMDEFMMLGFRMTAGPDFTEFNNKFGELPAVVYQDVLEKLKEKGLIDVVYNAGEITACFLTDKGLDLANIVFEEFV